MKLLIDVPDDFKPGECYDYTNGVNCPFAARGCWSGAKGFEKCPLKEAGAAVLVTNEVEALARRHKDKNVGSIADIYGKPVELYAVEIKKP